MRFSIVAAIDNNGGIGFENKLPWRLKEDMAFFKDITTSVYSETVIKKYFNNVTEAIPENMQGQLNVVIMGRKTWDSLPAKFKPLPNRKNIVLSRNTQSNIGAEVFTSLEDALLDIEQYNLYQGNASINNVFVLGGGELYEYAIKHPNCQRLYLTRIHQEFKCDTFFPVIKDWKVLQESETKLEKSLLFNFSVYGKVE